MKNIRIFRDTYLVVGRTATHPAQGQHRLSAPRKVNDHSSVHTRVVYIVLPLLLNESIIHYPTNYGHVLLSKITAKPGSRYFRPFVKLNM